ncbi:MAG: ribonuclease HI family protein [Chloroflexus sp.]|nr:ribonuclease HI family protein [Chloroflexus sp.]
MVSRFVRALLHRFGDCRPDIQSAPDPVAAPVTTPPAAGVSRDELPNRSRDLSRPRIQSVRLTEWLIVQIDGTLGFPARGVAGLGMLVRSERGAVIRVYCGRAPARTSQEAEYQALIAALRLIRHDFPNRRVRCLTDSRLVVDQLNGVAAVRTEPIRLLYQTARELIDQFPPATFELVRIPRDLNRLADALAWEALGGRHALLRQARVRR